MGRFQPGMPWPCKSWIFSSRVNSLSTRSARWSRESRVFIHARSGGRWVGPPGFAADAAPTATKKPRITAKDMLRKVVMLGSFNLQPPVSRLLPAAGYQFDKAVIKLHSAVIGVYPDSLIFAVRPDVINIDGNPVDPVGRETSLGSIFAIRCARFHHREHRDTRPHRCH